MHYLIFPAALLTAMYALAFCFGIVLPPIVAICVALVGILVAFGVDND